MEEVQAYLPSHLQSQSTVGLHHEKQAKYKKGPCYNYGVRLPDKEKSFADLDKETADTQWADTIAYEIGCYDLRKVYADVGVATKELINKY